MYSDSQGNDFLSSKNNTDGTKLPPVGQFNVNSVILVIFQGFSCKKQQLIESCLSRITRSVH